MHVRSGGGGEEPGRLLEGGNRGAEADYCGSGTVEPNLKGTEYSVPVASVWVLEHHHPTMSKLWEHGYRSKIKEERKILKYVT